MTSSEELFTKYLTFDYDGGTLTQNYYIIKYYEHVHDNAPLTIE